MYKRASEDVVLSSMGLLFEEKHNIFVLNLL